MSKSLLSLSGQTDPEELVPTGWSGSHLSSICQIFGGGRMGLTKEKHYQSSGVLAYSAAGPDGFVEQAEIEGKDGVVLSAIGARCGRCFLATGAWTTLANVQAIIPSDALDAKYLFYYVNRDGYWERSGSAQPFIKPSSIKSSWVVFPPSKPEQTKIAEILSTVDRAIEQTEALIAKQQRLKTGLMQDLLTRGIDEHGNLRSEHTHEFKDSPLGRIPVEWEVVTLSHYVARLDAGVSVNADDTPCGSGQIGVLKTSALSKGRFISEQNKSVIRDDISRVRTPLRANTVLVSRMNTPALVGESAYIDRDYPELFLPDRIWMTVFQDGMESAARWIGFILTSPSARNYISLNATGTSGSMKNLPKKSLLSMPIASPNTLEEVNRITQVLIRFEMNGNETDSRLAKLRSIKTALMQDLLTGRKRVTELLNNLEVPI